MHYGRRFAAIISILAGCCAAAQPATTRSAKISDEANALLQTLAQAYAKLPSAELAGTLTLTVRAEYENITRQTPFTSIFLAPHRFRHEITDQPLVGSTGDIVYACSQQTGTYVQLEAAQGKIMWNQLPPDVAAILTAQNPSLALAICKDPARQLAQSAWEINLAPDQEIDGKKYPTLQLLAARPILLLIDPQTHLVRRQVTDLTDDLRQRGRQDITLAQFIVDYHTLRPNAPLQPRQFAWTVPEGAKDLVAAARAAKMREEAAELELASSRLVGEPAPDFDLESLDGKKIKLSDLKGSVVVLDFFATWCPPCELVLRRMQTLYTEKQAQGLKVVLVNLRESKPVVKDYMDQKKLTMPVVLDPDGQAAKRFLIEGPPEMVLIGRDGKVKKVGAGYDPHGEPPLRQTLDALLQESP
jgi:peroxiredoxin/outer membrane lipoprotein-sorting protein